MDTPRTLPHWMTQKINISFEQTIITSTTTIRHLTGETLWKWQIPLGTVHDVVRYWEDENPIPVLPERRPRQWQEWPQRRCSLEGIKWQE